MIQMVQISLIPILLALVGCGGDSNAFHLEIGKKYPLELWPDSAYFVAMDSIVFYENVRAPDAPTPEVSINSFMGPVNPTKPKAMGTPSEKPVAQQAVEQGEGKRQEAFARRFQTAMDRLLANPEDASLSQSISMQEGEDLMDLLVRVYGKDASRLPGFVVKSQVQSLNGGALKPGQAVKLPKL